MASEKQTAALQRAREAKAAKKLEDEMKVSSEDLLGLTIAGNSNTIQTAHILIPKFTFEEKQVWLNAILTVMRTREVKSSVAVKDCIPVADEVLSAYKAKFE